MIKNVCLVSFVLLFTSCWVGTENIIDEYEVTWQDPYTQGWEGYTIGCKSRGKSDKTLEDVKNISWNEKVIIAEKNNEENARWYTFVAAGDTLQCFNDDRLLGPFTKIQIDSIVRVNNYTNLNEKIFVE